MAFAEHLLGCRSLDIIPVKCFMQYLPYKLLALAIARDAITKYMDYWSILVLQFLYLDFHLCSV